MNHTAAGADQRSDANDEQQIETGRRRTPSARSTVAWWRVYALVLFVPFVLVFVLVFGIRSHWGSGQWGDVATWLSGCSTLAAVVVALRQNVIASRVAARAVLDAAAAKAEAEARLEREIEAYSERVEAQLKKSDELYGRRARAEALAIQRSELMVLWPVLDEIQWAAINLPIGSGLTAATREGWDNQRARLALAHSRARLFIYDEQVLVAINEVVEAVKRFATFVDEVTDGTRVIPDPNGLKVIRRMQLTAIRAARSALQAKASACLTDFAPDAVTEQAAAWKFRPRPDARQTEGETDETQQAPLPLNTESPTA